MHGGQTIQVAVLHDDRLTRAGLVEALARVADFSVVDPPGTGHPPAHRDEIADAQVVIADLRSALRLARRRHAGCADHAAPTIVVISGPDRERDLREALEARIGGYLAAGFSLEELTDGVRAVHRGSRYLCPRAAARLAESVCFSALTAREEAVLELLAQGLCNKTIARQLGIALGTVKSHLKSAYGKLLVSSRTQAVLVSERRGLLARLGDRRAQPVSRVDQGPSRRTPPLH